MKVLLVDDDVEQLDVAAFVLRRDGFVVTETSDSSQALKRFRLERPDVVVVNLDLSPDGGAEIVRRIRAESRTPLIVKAEPSDRDAVLRSLELGADDFITRSYVGHEIALRVLASVRRASRASREEPEDALQVAGLQLDPESRVAARGTYEVRLTPTEFRICYTLLKNAGHVVPADRLLTFVGGSGGNAASTLRSHICHLRRKLRLDGAFRGEITSVPAVGYVFQPPRLHEVVAIEPAHVTVPT